MKNKVIFFVIGILIGSVITTSGFLIYKEIKNDDIKLIIYPLLQDVIYSCNVDLNKEYKWF